MLLLTSKINAVLNTYTAIIRKAEGVILKMANKDKLFSVPFVPQVVVFTTELQVL